MISWFSASILLCFYASLLRGFAGFLVFPVFLCLVLCFYGLFGSLVLSYALVLWFSGPPQEKEVENQKTREEDNYKQSSREPENQRTGEPKKETKRTRELDNQRTKA